MKTAISLLLSLPALSLAQQIAIGTYSLPTTGSRVGPVMIKNVTGHPPWPEGSNPSLTRPCERHWSNGLMTNGSTPLANRSVRLRRCE
jgi:hypothetical protein